MYFLSCQGRENFKYKITEIKLEVAGETILVIDRMIAANHARENMDAEEKTTGSVFLPPAYVVRREVMFSHVCVCSTFGGGGVTPSKIWKGVPHPTMTGWGTPPPAMTGWGWIGYPPPWRDGVTPPTHHHDRMGYPPGQDWMGYTPGQDWMVYPPPTMTGWGTLPIRQSIIVSTCYMAGSMPLAFM